MAQTAVDVVVRVKDLAALDRLKKSLAGVEGATLKGERGIKRFETSLAKLGRTLAGLAVGDQLRRAFGAAAELSGTEQRINNITKKYQQFAGIQRSAAEAAKTFAVSQAQALSDFGDLASRLGSTGVSLKDLENIYGGFNTLLIENAVGAQQAASAQLQLNQALGSGRLAGEEFRAISEATPQLLTEVAKVLGVARGELKQLGAEGQITSQVLIQALTNIKTQGADALAAAFDTPAGKLRIFNKAVNDFQVAVGNELLPVITPLIKALSDLLAQFSQLPSPVKAAAVGITAVAAAAVLLAPGIAAVVGGLKAATAGLLALGAGAGASTAALSFTTKAVLALKGALIATGWGIAAAGAVALAAGIYKLANRGKEVEKQFNKQTESVEAFNDINNRATKAIKSNSLKAINDVISALKGEIRERIANNEEITQQIELMQKLKAAQAGANNDFGGGNQSKPATSSQRKNSQKSIQLDIDTAGLENARQLSDAFYDTQLKIVDLQKQRAVQSGNINAQLQAELQKAQLIYQQTVSQIQQEVAKAQLKARQVELATSELKAELLLKKAKEGVNAADLLAYKQQQATLALAKQQVSVAQKLAQVQLQGAKAVYQAQVSAARFNAKNSSSGAGAAGGLAQLNSAAISAANSVTVLGEANSQGATTSRDLARKLAEIGKTGVFSRAQANAILSAHTNAANNLNAAAGSLQGAAGSLRRSGGGFGKATGSFYQDPRRTKSVLSAKERSYVNKMIAKGYLPRTQYKTTMFAEGGYVDKPTRAMIGEGGESEYVIPASKMDSAMSRYKKGARGEAVVEGSASMDGVGSVKGKAVVNVNTGPVMRMNNKDYVTVNDMNSAIGNVVASLSESDGNYSTRARIG